MFIFAPLRKEVSIISLTITGFFFFFIINIYLVINCFKSIRVLNTIKREDFNSSEKRKSIIAGSTMLTVVGMSMLILWIIRKSLGIESAVLIYAFVAIVSGIAYIVFEYTLKKSALKRKLQRDYNEQ